MLKIFLSCILISTTFFASSTYDLLDKIDKIYKTDFYFDYHKLESLSIKNFKNDSIHKKVKEDFEKLLPLYLKEKEIFGKSKKKLFGQRSDLMDSKERTDFVLKIIMLNRFLKISLIYIDYLDSIGRIEEAKEIIKKNFTNLNILINNAIQDIIVYISILNYFDNLYNSKILLSNNLLCLIQKYPPPGKYIWVEKERRNILNLIDKDYASMKFQNSIEKKNNQLILKFTKKYINLYYEKLITSFKNESKQMISEYYEYIKKEKNNISEVDYTEEELKLNKISKDKAEKIAKVSALCIQTPMFEDIFQKHIKIVKEYNSLIHKKACAKGNKFYKEIIKKSKEY